MKNIRATFASTLYEEMKDNKDIYVLTADLGYKMWDKIRDDYPSRFVNVGAAEQTMMDIAIGLAYSGKIPFCYSITPFLIYRPFEALRTYINHEKLNVKLVGGGHNKDYAHDGISHYAHDVEMIMRPLTNITVCVPYDDSVAETVVREMVKSDNPYLVILKR